MKDTKQLTKALIQEIGQPLSKEQKEAAKIKELEEKQAEEKAKLNEKQNRIKELFRNSNIPKRYLSAKLEPMTPEQEKLKEKFKKALNCANLNAMRDILIYGSVGTGKTYLTIGLINQYIENGISCRYITQYELLELYFQKDFNNFNAFKKVDFLVIDELGKVELAPWQLIVLEELISYRYNEMIPTVYITNLDQGNFKKFVGSRVEDRLRDNKVVSCTLIGESLRG